ncbi:UDP-glucose 4-epimerase GalE [Erysipelotrichaceae bacterium OH741_COT-311]|nr:UDP-glucose 4-epimerase GalE [Erysipelotrichaceae bacterium OH741_COT-311]
MKILVTGGTGYIGSHTCVELIKSGHEVVIVDNLYNSSITVLDAIEHITKVKPTFYQVDILDKIALNQVFLEHKFDAVIHFAGYKAVGESVSIPLTYYQNNVAGSLNLYEIMREHNVKKLVFSSSATVYGDPHTVPIKEDFPLSTTNPYGTTKLFNEMILQDLYKSDPTWSIALLRYFNPIGAHESGLIGEVPNGIPNNLLPYIAQTAVGIRDYLRVFGDDYDTVDGTGVRDYIHVVDLAQGHVKACEYVIHHESIEAFNLGTGKGYSVLQLKNAFEKASGKEVPFKIVERRPGDVATCYADPTKALELLGFKAKCDVDQMCKDSWNFQKNLK